MRGRNLWSVNVPHCPYPLFAAEVHALKRDLVVAAGLPTSEAPPIVHFASGMDVNVSTPRIGPGV
ncbi:MAG: DUF2071 domain-containing protein [Chloroflexi bacterium]|nr:DUF2071 domain-containing protein [Chloroflexota bacterium]